MARESALWSWLSKARIQLGAGLHMERIENLIAAGTPDVEGFVSVPDWAGQFWIELKSSERPARPDTPIRFKLRNRERQIAWMAKRWCLGGNAFFLLQVGSGPDRRLYLAPGDMGALLFEGVTESRLGVECVNYGVFSKTIRQQQIIKRIIQCRSLPCHLGR